MPLMRGGGGFVLLCKGSSSIKGSSGQPGTAQGDQGEAWGQPPGSTPRAVYEEMSGGESNVIQAGEPGRGPVVLAEPSLLGERPAPTGESQICNAGSNACQPAPCIAKLDS